MLELIKAELKKNGIPESQFFSANFESKSLPFANEIDSVYHFLKRFIAEKNGKVYLFFDEIQELPKWETLLNSLMIDFDVDIYVTGSNAKLLSGELTTYIAGRYVEFRIYPFSYAETLLASGSASGVEAFQQYITAGGMPFLHVVPMDDTDAKKYLGDIYDSIILKDIVIRHNVRDIDLLKRIITYFAANIGNTFSSSNISKYLKNKKRSVSTETVYNYIDYCKSACLLHLVQREDIIGKRTLQFTEKIYIDDCGIRETIFGNNLKDINQVLENIVYLELMRRGYMIRIGKAGEKEIDFVASLSGEKIYVQVCYLLASDEIIEREFSALERIPDNYPKYVVSMDEISQSRNGIKHVNIRQFLLSDSL
jgi:predicted AAA+ superfamily ATPase